MKEHPILFSAAMVRAILAGTKTQTRRVVKPQPAFGCHFTMNGAGTKALHLAEHVDHGAMICVPPTGRSKDHTLPCPYGVTGDNLWVREAWAPADAMYGREQDPPQTVGYLADKSAVVFDADLRPHAVPAYDLNQWNWASLKGRPSIHMPRWASRITLQVTDVRVERLQAISEEDAKAEGIHEFRLPNGSIFGVQGVKGTDVGASAREAFAILWDQINAKRAPWSANPWVWVIEFRRVQA